MSKDNTSNYFISHIIVLERLFFNSQGAHNVIFYGKYIGFSVIAPLIYSLVCVYLAVHCVHWSPLTARMLFQTPPSPKQHILLLTHSCHNSNMLGSKPMTDCFGFPKFYMKCHTIQAAIANYQA